MPVTPPTSTTSPPRAWAEVNLAHLEHNYSLVGNYQRGHIMTVLKAGAYGHGLKKIASKLDNIQGNSSPAFFGVASVIEARRLAESGIQTRLYLLGPTCPFEREEIVLHGWTPCISNLEEAEDFNRITKSISAKKLRVHIVVDTGMGRGGFLPDDLIKKIDTLESMDALEIEGIGSHLPSADEDRQFTLNQFEQFDSLVENLGVERFRFRHLANSAGLLDYQSRTTNLYRPGIMLYGISPLPGHQSELKPVMSLKSRVSLVRNLPAGQGISYGRETVLEKDTAGISTNVAHASEKGRSRSLVRRFSFLCLFENVHVEKGSIHTAHTQVRKALVHVRNALGTN